MVNKTILQNPVFNFRCFQTHFFHALGGSGVHFRVRWKSVTIGFSLPFPFPFSSLTFYPFSTTTPYSSPPPKKKEQEKS